MKANKALKRLTHVQALLSDVSERYSASTSIKAALRDAKDAVARAKAGVGKDVPSGKAKKPLAKQSGPTSRAMPGLPKAKRKGSAAAAPQKVAVAPARTLTKTRTPVKRAIKRTPKGTVPARMTDMKATS
jgi:hypothetical protein